MALPVLAAALAAAVPVLGPFALAIAATAILVGAYPLLQAAIEDLTRGSFIDRARALFNLRTLINNIMSQPVAQESLRAQGVDAGTLAQSASAALTAAALSQVPPLTFPYDATLEELELWYQGEGALWSQGLSTQARIDSARSFYVTQGTTLRAALLPGVVAAPLQAVTPLTQVQVPGFGMVGVTVRVGGQLITPVTAPVAAPALPTLIQLPPITVPAPVVNVAAPSVTVLPAPLPQVLVNAPVDVAPIASALTGALPLVGTAAITGLLSQAQNLGHFLQVGRNQCLGGTAGALMNLLLPTALGIFSVRALQSETGIGGWIQDRAESWIEGAMERAPYPVPATPEGVAEAAADRLKQAFTFGLQAHMWAILGESNFVLKSLGLPQVAGFMAEMAGFKRIAEATIGEVEKAALSTPARHFALRKYRPNVPGLADLEEMYAKKEIPFEARSGVLGLRQALALWGLSDEWAGVYKEHLWKDPRLSEIIRIGQFFNPMLVEETRLPTAETAAWMERAGIGAYATKPGDWYYAWRAAKGGYDPRDVAVLVETARRAVTRREQTLFLDAITRLARDGFIPLEMARELTREGWGVAAGPFATGDPIEARARAIELQADYKVLADTRAVVLMSMSRGTITREEARAQLGQLGLDGTRVELEVLKATLGMLPGMRLAISRPEEVLEEAGLEAE